MTVLLQCQQAFISLNQTITFLCHLCMAIVRPLGFIESQTQFWDLKRALAAAARSALW
jgi:hypothetical protein